MADALDNDTGGSLCHLESGFFCLSGETRNNVYHFVVASLPTPYITSPKSLRKTSSLAQASKRIRQEYNSYVARYSVHKLSTTSCLWTLDTMIFSGQGAETTRSLINSVHFPQYCEMASSPSRASEIMDLCQSLPNLKALTLDLSLDHLQMPYIFYHCDNDSDESDTDEGQDDSTQPAISQATLNATLKIIENYALGQILYMPRLETLTVTCKPGDGGMDPNAVTLFKSLRPLLETGFCGSSTGRVRAVHCKKEFVSKKSLGFTLQVRRG